MIEMTESAASSPPGLVILLIQIIDSLFTSINFAQWRHHIPFGLCDASSNCWLWKEPPGWPGEYFPEFPSYHTFLTQNHLEHSLSSLHTFAFQTPTTSLGILTSKDAIATLTILVLTIRHIKAVLIPVFCNIGRNIGTSTHGPEWEHKNPERIMKFGEYVFRFLYHSTLSAVGVWYFWDAPWWDSSKGGTTNLWLEFPNQSVDVGMIWYYLVQCAYNIDAIIYLMEHSILIRLQSPRGWQSPLKVSWNPNLRGDFMEMAVHHVITNILVIGSSHFRLTRGGVFVFMLHDISDIPVDMSKLANFMKRKLATTLCFALMVITWTVFRLGILPFVMLKSVVTESHLVCSSGKIPLDMYHMWYPLFFGMMVSIIALHVHWYIIIVKIGWYLLHKGEQHDLTEHKQGEEQKLNSEIKTDK